VQPTVHSQMDAFWSVYAEKPTLVGAGFSAIAILEGEMMVMMMMVMMMVMMMMMMMMMVMMMMMMTMVMVMMVMMMMMMVMMMVGVGVVMMGGIVASSYDNPTARRLLSAVKRRWRVTMWAGGSDRRCDSTRLDSG
jgi:hypothetical protein